MYDQIAADAIKQIQRLREECADHEKQRIISELLRKADEAHAERDYARETRLRDAAACVSSC